MTKNQILQRIKHLAKYFTPANVLVSLPFLEHNKERIENDMLKSDTTDVTIHVCDRLYCPD